MILEPGHSASEYSVNDSTLMDLTVSPSEETLPVSSDLALRRLTPRIAMWPTRRRVLRVFGDVLSL